MSLQKMLAAHDDLALTALSSKGLTRRARRDANNGKAEIIFSDSSHADILVDGQNVNIDTKGPLTAKCTCSSTRLCRHVLSAVMILRDSIATAPPSSSPTDHTEQPQKQVEQICAQDELVQMSETFIVKFAGADLSTAITLAASIDEPNIATEGLNLRVTLPDSPAMVTFIAGQGLKGVAYKGPQTKSRLIITTCAILIRRLSGLNINISTENRQASKIQSLSRKNIQQMADSIPNALRSVLSGVPAIAADHLFDQAIAARVQTAPRLTAQLRALAKQAMQATSRHISYDPETFLQNAASCYALCHAIIQNPEDNNLTGSLKRDYHPSSPLELIMVGARAWRSPAGARGLTCYGYSPQTSQWYETTTARAAGMDLSFNAHEAYHGSLWQAGSPHAMMGHNILLPKPSISNDLQVSQTGDESGRLHDQPLTMKALNNHKIIVNNWQDLRNDIMMRAGVGIRRKVTPFPVLIQPDKHLEFSFDEMSQVYKWGVVDRNNEVIYLDIIATEKALAKRIENVRGKISAILVVVRFEGFEVIYEPVSILLEHKSAVNVFNIGLDPLEYRRLLGHVKPKLSDFFPQFTPPLAQDHQASMQLLDQILETLVDIAVSPTRRDRLAPLAQHCEQAGLSLLATTIANTHKNRTEDNILKTAYLLNETRYLISLSN